MTRTKIGRLAIPLFPEQKEAKAGILSHTVSFLSGEAGTSKTFVAVATALSLYIKKEIEHIVITRPIVDAGDNIGFLPGDTGPRDGKFAPYLAPVLETFEKIIGTNGRQIVDQMLEREQIRIIPPQHLRGNNFEHSVVIVDEYQNLTAKQLTLVLSRICKTGKIVFAGDDKQIDLIPEASSCINILHRIEGSEDVYFQEMKTNHRHPVAIKLIRALQDESSKLWMTKDNDNVKDKIN